MKCFQNKMIGGHSKYWLALLLVVFSGFPGAAKNLYVRKGAAGSNNGSDWNNAWTDCSSIVWGGAGVNAGDTVWFAGGAYTTTLIPGISGTSGAWISIKRVRTTDSGPASAAGWNSSYDSQVVINTGNDALDFNTLGLSYIIIDGRIDGGLQLVTPNTAGASVGINHAINYVTLTNLDLAGPGGSTPITMNGDNRGIDATAWNGSVYEPVNHLVVSHCRIHGQVNNLWLMNCYNTTIEYTKMYDSAAANSVTYHANVCATSGCTNITWRYNEIYNHQVEGIMCIFGGAANWYIYGNVWHDGMTGVSRVLEVQDGVEGPMFFYNNTVVNVPMGNRTANGGTYAAGSQARNNLYWNSGAGGLPDNDYDFINGSLSETHGIANGSNPFVNYSGQNYHIISNLSSTLPRNKGAGLTTPFNLDLDGNVRGSDGTWDIGAYEYNTGSSDMTPPTVTLIAPVAGVAVSNTVTLSATASDNTNGSGVASVIFLVDGVAVGSASATPYSITWNSLTVTNGTHGIQALAQDGAGNQTTSSNVTVTVFNSQSDTTPPTTSLTAPAANAVVSNLVTLSATASDNTGGSGVASVSFLVDGAVVGSSSTAPYSTVWSSLSVMNGTHSIQARAQDVAGNQTTSSSVTVTVQNAGSTLTTGLVGYWPFDDASGTRAKDSSGYGNNGNLLGDAAWGTGFLHGCLALDGQSGYVQVPSTPNLEQVTNAVTICAWVKFGTNIVHTAGDMQDVARKVISETNNPAPYSAYDLVVQDFGSGTFKARMGVTRASDSTRGTSDWGSAHTYGSWCHLAGVYDGSTVQIYVNGILESSVAFSGAVLQVAQPLCLGRYGTVGEAVDGLMDDLRLYNRALSAAEIQTLYSATSPAAPSGLMILPN